MEKRLEEMMEQMAGEPTLEDPLPGNSHWLDKNGRGGFSEYFWKSKYPCLLEATGHSSEEIERLCNDVLV